MLKLTPALCKYLEELGLPIFVTPSTNNDTKKIEIAIYIFGIEQTEKNHNKIMEILRSIEMSSYVGDKNENPQ